MPKSLFGYTDFEDETQTELVDGLFARWDTVYQNWLFGEYGKSAWLEDVLTDDPEAREWKDMHWCLYCHFTGDYDGLHYRWIEASDWLSEHSDMTKWPTSLESYRRELRSLYSIPVLCPIPHALPVTPEIIDALPVGPNMPNLPNEFYQRRSNRIKKQREFYYGY